MERHDIELKERMDNEVTIHSEEIHASSYIVNITFEYQEVKYLVWGEIEDGGVMGVYFGVDIIGQGEVKWDDPLHDTLHDIAEQLISNVKITRDKIEL